MAKKVVEIGPQPGFQTQVLSHPADIAWIGGAAGCGKTFCALLEPLKHIRVHGFSSLTFRREYVQINSPGGLWQKSVELYTKIPMKDHPRIVHGDFTYYFPAGATVAFDHLNREHTVYNYQGPEIPLIQFDELTHFTEFQFNYMETRNRTTCGVRPYMRASTNPQGYGWVKDRIAWYLYPDDYHIEHLQGAPIPERAGAIRYFRRHDDVLVWGNSPDEVLAQLPPSLRKRPEFIRSFAFIPGKLADNQVLMESDPAYEGIMLGLPEKERVQLYEGRWIDPDIGNRRLFSDIAIRDMFANFIMQPTGRRYITADIALEGADRFVIMVWDGWTVIDVRIHEKCASDEIVPHIENAAIEYGVPPQNITFDAGGIGGAYKGFLRASVPFIGAGLPRPEDLTPYRTDKNLLPRRPQYKNLRAQCFYYLKTKLDDCGIYFAVKSIHLQRDVQRELAVIKRHGDQDDDKYQIIPKDEIRLAIGRSPDLADALSMRSIFDLQPPPTSTGRLVGSF